MSKATKRKHVTKEVLDEYVLPDDKKAIVKVISSKGNNLHEIETADKKTFLASMPTKFRKNVWIKRGDYVMIEPIEEGDKVKAEIVHILYKDQIKYIKDEGLWPDAFKEKEKEVSNAMIPSDMLPPSDSDDSDNESDGDGGLMTSNPNRPLIQFVESEEEDSCEDEVYNEEDEQQNELDEEHYTGR